MFPAASTVAAAVKPVQPVEHLSAHRTSVQQSAETGRASSGETSAANTRTETAQAVKAAEQSAVAPRLRDQEKAEQTNRDAPTGPPPAFDESLLERQARLAFEPPEVVEDRPEPKDDAPGIPATSGDQTDPPPTPRERAEVSFAETRTLAAPKEPTVNVEV